MYEVAPEGYSCILFLSFDLDAESAEVYRRSDPNTLSRGRFAVYRGVFKVLEVLGKYGVKTTFFTPSWVIERYPNIIEEIVSREHEVAAHGYLHERFDQLSEDDEKEVFDKTIKVFEEVVGYKPHGFRSPYWKWSKYTLRYLFDLGFTYDSSLMDDEIPYIIKSGNKQLVEFPVDWRLDDWPYLEYYRSLTPQQLLSQWLEELDYAVKTRGYLSITMHPQCIGRGARIRVLEKLVEKAVNSKAWIVKGEELAKYMLKSIGKKWLIVREHPVYEHI